mgnify:CR=1 FL=1|jgi:hypothetical protein
MAYTSGQDEKVENAMEKGNFVLDIEKNPQRIG